MEGLTGSIEVAARALGAGLCMGLGAIGPLSEKVMLSVRLLRVWQEIPKLRVISVQT